MSLASTQASASTFHPTRPESKRLRTPAKSPSSRNRPLAASVTSYLDSDKEPVILAVKFGTLNDGTTYQSESVLEAKAKKLKVTGQNSGYRKAA